MGKKKDKALGRKVRNRDIERIDELVYQHKNGSESELYEAQKEILRYFDSYLEKYANLFLGVTVDLSNYDTRGFLGMFLSNRPKTAENLSHQRTYIARVMSRFSREDIKAQLTVIFLTVLEKHRIVEGVNALNPLTRIFRWRVKDWFNKIVKDPLFKTVEPRKRDGNAITLEEFIDLHNYVEPDFTELDTQMDLAWVLSPKKSLYQGLSTYERYLVSLVFQQKFPISQVAEKLQRDKDTVKRHLRTALKKLEARFSDAGPER